MTEDFGLIKLKFGKCVLVTLPLQIKLLRVAVNAVQGSPRPICPHQTLIVFFGFLSLSSNAYPHFSCRCAIGRISLHTVQDFSIVADEFNIPFRLLLSQSR